jgi:transcriptional regulator with GAF, ATPase, and Fis domain/pSer/pThr/pTyr-binding forkhead associated (FHA) protein
MDAPAFLIADTGERTPLAGEVTIGRASGVTILLDDPAASRRHAVIRPTALGFELQDLQSANGTYVNDDLLERPVLLRSGDRIRIGTSDFTFTLAIPEPEDSPTEASPIPEPEFEENADRTVYAPIPEEDPLPAPLPHPQPAADQTAPPSPTPVPLSAPWPEPQATGEAAKPPPNPLKVAARAAGLIQEREDLAGLLERMARLLAETYQVEAAGFYLPIATGAELTCAVAEGELASSLLWGRAAAGHAGVGQAFAENRAVRLSGAGDLAEDAALLSRLPAGRIRSLLAAPIAVRDGGVVCVLALINPAWKPAFDDADLDFAILLAQQLAVAAPGRSNWESLARLSEAEVRAESLRRDFVTVQPELSDSARRAMDLIGSGRTVYLWGEPGSGRRHLARIANRLAGDESAPFIEVDLAALPAAQQQEALFGEGGAWRRATSGLLYLAHPAALSPEAARALVTRLSAKDHPRVALAGEQALQEAQVDESLLAALGDHQIGLPPLRERMLDLAPLVAYFIQRFTARYDGPVTGFAADALQQLEEYHWPGNVAELAGVVLRTVVLGQSPTISREALSQLAPEIDLPGGAVPAGRSEVEQLCEQLLSADPAPEAGIAELRHQPATQQAMALSLLIRAVETASDPDERAQRLSVLIRAGDSRSVAYAAGHLDDPAASVRLAAILAFAEIAAPEPVRARLRALAGDAHEAETGAVALLALGRQPDPASLDLLRRALEGDDETRRTLAAAAIAAHDPAQPGVAALWAALLERAEVLPAPMLLRLAEDPAWAEPLRALAASNPGVIRAGVADALYLAWRPEALLRLLRLLRGSAGPDSSVGATEAGSAHGEHGEP